MEIIEDETDIENNDQVLFENGYDLIKSSDTLKDLINCAEMKKKPLHRAISTAETVKKNLKSQLKIIIKNHSSIHPTLDASANSPRKSSTKIMRSNLLKQVDNHSFKSSEIFPIQSIIKPSNLKDPKAISQAKIPSVKTKYQVKIIKKPYSMKWLHNRRLSLFLQSDLYHEFKLGMLLAQFEPINDSSEIF